MGSNPRFRLRIDRLRSCARRAAPSAAERRLLENLRQKIKSLDVNFLGKTIRAECIIGAYEAYSSRSVHSHLNLERLEWWAPEGRKRLLHTPPLGRRGRRPGPAVAPPSAQAYSRPTFSPLRRHLSLSPGSRISRPLAFATLVNWTFVLSSTRSID